MAPRTFRLQEQKSVDFLFARPVAMRATAHVTAFPGLVSAPRAGPSRRGPVRVTASREPQNSATSMGLALSGSVMSLNGGLAKFAVRDDVSVSRTEESGKTTVTIKARAPVPHNTAQTPCGVWHRGGSQRAAWTPGCASAPRAWVSPHSRAAYGVGVPPGWWQCCGGRRSS